MAGVDLSIAFGWLSSLSVILGVVFVVFQLRQNNKLVQASVMQARATAEQVKFVAEQLRMESLAGEGQIVLETMKILSQAEVLKYWWQIDRSPYKTYDDIQNDVDHQRGAEIITYLHRLVITFEGVGVLVKRGVVPLEVVDDFMHGLVGVAWQRIEPLVNGYRKEMKHVEYAEWFEYLYLRMNSKMTNEEITKMLQERRLRGVVN